MNSQLRTYADEVRRRSLQDLDPQTAPAGRGLFTIAAPRFLVVFLWLVSSWFTGMFASLAWPLVGVLVMPTTLLWYSAVYHWFDGAWTFFAIVGLVAAIVIDLSSVQTFLRIRKQRAGTL